VHYGHNEAAARQTLAAIEKAGGHAFAIRADLGSEDGPDTLVRELEARLEPGTLDILVNNAGIASKGLDRIDMAEFDHIFAVNVRAPFFIIQRALPLLADGARIVNVSSGATRIALRDFAYSMTKGAVDVMGRVLANSLGDRGITVNTVAPGMTDTDMSESIDEDVAAAIGRFTALGRLGAPADIADAVAFLVSGDARWVTGQVLDVSGGLWLGPRGPGDRWRALAPGPNEHGHQ
jgi:3-oxoacyl-[acyl-carrier protein] reductase